MTSLKNGKFGDDSFRRLFEELDRGQAVGVLVAERGTVVKKVFFHNGQITFCASSDPRELVGQYLLKAGLITEDDLREAMDRQVTDARPIGRILEALAKVTEAEVERTVLRKFRETVLDLFVWEDGTWTFHPGELAQPSSAGGQLEIRATRLQGMRRAELWRELRLLLPSDDLRFTVSRDVFPEGFPSTAADRRLVDLAESGKTIGEIRKTLPGQDFGISSRFADFLRMGVLAFTGPTTKEKEKEKEKPKSASPGFAPGATWNVERTSDPSDPRILAILSMAEKAVQEDDTDLARTLYHKILKVDPKQPTALAALSELGRITSPGRTPASSEPKGPSVSFEDTSLDDPATPIPVPPADEAETKSPASNVGRGETVRPEREPVGSTTPTRRPGFGSGGRTHSGAAALAMNEEEVPESRKVIPFRARADSPNAVQPTGGAPQYPGAPAEPVQPPPVSAPAPAPPLQAGPPGPSLPWQQQGPSTSLPPIWGAPPTSQPHAPPPTAPPTHAPPPSPPSRETYSPPPSPPPRETYSPPPKPAPRTTTPSVAQQDSQLSSQSPRAGSSTGRTLAIGIGSSVATLAVALVLLHVSGIVTFGGQTGGGDSGNGAGQNGNGTLVASAAVPTSESVTAEKPESPAGTQDGGSTPVTASDPDPVVEKTPRPTPTPEIRPTATPRPAVTVAAVRQNTPPPTPRPTRTPPPAPKGPSPAEKAKQAKGLSDQGMAKLDGGDFAGAIPLFKRALSLDPKNANAHIGLGTAYMLTGNNAAAKASLRKFLQVAPNDPLAGQARQLLQSL